MVRVISIKKMTVKTEELRTCEQLLIITLIKTFHVSQQLYSCLSYLNFLDDQVLAET